MLLLLLSTACFAWCTTNYNCSFNGDCDVASNSCNCYSGWSGEWCHQLKLAPARNGTGYDRLHTEDKMSSWGGQVFQDDDGLYHGYFSEMTHHCGIHRWNAQSTVVHAVSKDPIGPYKKVSTPFGVFTHEPSFLRAPTGEWILYVTHWDGPTVNTSAGIPGLCNCTDGSSGSGGQACWGENGSAVPMMTYMSTSDSPYGPWSALEESPKWDGWPNTDMNFVAAFRKNGTLLALTRWMVIEASDWKDQSTYFQNGWTLKPGLGYGIGEDPDIWMDRNGMWHMVSHNGPRGGHPSNGTGDCGRHWFSATGNAGTWDSAPTGKELMGGCAYNRTAYFEDGTLRLFYRRERPHIVLDRFGTIQALLTSVIDNPVINGKTPSDASYTLFQRVIP